MINESLDFFKYFQSKRTDITKQIESKAPDCRQQLSLLEKELNNACLYLSAYDQEMLSKQIREMQALLNAQTEKKGFKFKRSVKQTEKQAEITKEAETVGPQMTELTGDGCVLTSDAEDLQVNGCKRSIIRLDNLKTLFIKNVDRCYLVCHVDGSVFVENCTNSTIVVHSRQLRIHKTQSTHFYCGLKSNAIIEDCSDLVFTGLPSVVVDDFNWLRKEQSPNYKIVDKQLVEPQLEDL